MLEQDLKPLSTEELEREYLLAFEALNGHYLNGEKVLAGLLERVAQVTPHHSPTSGQLHAIKVWTERLKRAEEELFERKVLS